MFVRRRLPIPLSLERVSMKSCARKRASSVAAVCSKPITWPHIMTMRTCSTCHRLAKFARWRASSRPNSFDRRAHRLEVGPLAKGEVLRLRNFRAGIEASISCFKRAYGGARCTWRGVDHFKAYIRSAVVAYNLMLFARLKSP
jgi:hypothetical protein